MVPKRKPGYADSEGSIDLVLLVVAIFLIGIGIVMVYSSSFALAEKDFGSSSFFLKRHLFRVILSLMVMWGMVRLDYRVLRKWAIPLLFLGVLLLLLVLIPKLSFHLGPIKGTRRWIKLAGLTLQPAELVKIALVVYLADSLARRQERLAQFREGLFPYLLILGTIFGLLVLQPDFGYAMVVLIITMTLLFVGKAPLRHLALSGAVILPLLYPLIFKVDYRKARVLAFLHPGQVAPDLSYQVKQSLLGLGSGGLWGVGLGQGVQKFFYLPEPHTDFVFAVIGEELGFVGALTILVLFLLLAWRGVKIARAAPDLFGFLLAVGITTIIFVHVLINVGVACNLLPTTGLPLPFISYGGSSLLSTSAGVGILLSVSKRIHGEHLPQGAIRVPFRTSNCLSRGKWSGNVEGPFRRWGDRGARLPGYRLGR